MSPHCGFDEEIALLDFIFENGRPYCFDSVNRDRWYLYMLSGGGKYIVNDLLNNGVAYNNIIGNGVFNDYKTQIDDFILNGGGGFCQNPKNVEPDQT